MPQLTPYYFLNQITFAFAALLILVYILSKYVLPLFTLLQVARIYITKLSNKN
jgi:F-type H+-transporting ATPase subunit 8